MKNLIAIAFVVTSSFAIAQEATSTLFNIVQPGSYLGTDDAGNPCQVTVVAKKDRAEVSIQSELLLLKKTVLANSQFHAGRLGNQNVLFFQNEIITNQSDDTKSLEYSIRITNANENKISISLGKVVTDNRDVKIFSSGCNI